MLDLLGHSCDLHSVPNVTLVKSNTSSLLIFQLSDIQHRYTRTSHPIYLCDQQAQSARAPCYHDDLFTQIHSPRSPIRYPFVEDGKNIQDGQEGSVSDGYPKRGGFVSNCSGAQAERYHPGNEWMEDRVVCNSKEQIDGEVLVPWLIMWVSLLWHCYGS